MTVPAFRLEEAGFTRDQVEALAEFMGGSMATKADLMEFRGEVRSDIERLEGKIQSEITSLRGEMRADVERLEGKLIGLEGKMNADVERLEGKILALDERFSGKFNLVYWMLGVILLVEVIPYLKAFFGGG